jgi:hypothetical protein
MCSQHLPAQKIRTISSKKDSGGERHFGQFSAAVPGDHRVGNPPVVRLTDVSGEVVKAILT